MWAPRLTTRENVAVEIVRCLAADIEEGKLGPGEQLPTHRDLAERLKLAIGTISRAYAVARAQGLVTSTTGRGTFVAPKLCAPQGTVDLSRNVISRDLRDAEVGRLLAIYGDAAKVASLLDQDHGPAGVPEHRAVAAEWMRRPGFAPAPDDIVICSGVQHAMLTVLATITKPGDIVLTEMVAYAGIKATASFLRLDLRGLAIDAEGLEPQALEEACRQGAKFLYTAPTLHNPTAATMSDQRRREIARIIQAHGITVLEDDAYGFLVPEAPPPLAAYAPGHTYYLLSTSKSFAPGLRVAYAVCPPGMQKRIAGAIRTTSWGTSPLMSGLVTKWIKDGTVERTITYKRAEVKARHELAWRVLADIIPPAHPAPHWWVTLPEPWLAEDFANECRNRGVEISPASIFAINRDQLPIAVRICLAAVPGRRELEEGLHTINELLKHGPTNYFSTT
jgi:DNA-binding transcriptional MocR family regulator